MKILLVDADKKTVEIINYSFRLQWQGIEIFSAGDGEQASRIFYENNPDVILLDIVLPHKDGFSLLREIRRTNDVPVLIVSAANDELDKVKALEMGADDYVVKPFSSLELMARIRAVLRRTERFYAAGEMSSFNTGTLRLDFDNRAVYKRGQLIKMTPTEYRLLFLLARNAGRVVSFETLLDKVWGSEYREQFDYLKTYISRLRRKIEDEPENPIYLVTERSLGYRLVKLD